MNILLIEDNESIIKGLEYAFKQNNFNLVYKSDLKSAKEYLIKNKPNIIILDISLPDGNGYIFYKNNIKEKKIPTIFLTANDDEDNIVNCLEDGAEDYITKPFSTRELVARINRILSKNKSNNIINVKDITFDLDKMEVYKNNDKINLTSLELKILSLLFENINKVITRNYIIENIWKWTGNDVNDNTVTVYLKRIREKLDSDIIITLKGIGYRIDEHE
jgi:DNA-binding response OmpR family regulator